MLNRIALLLVIIALWTNFSNACPISLSFTSQDATCPLNNDGWAKVSVSGGSTNYAYNWTPGGATSDSIGALTPGWYTVTVNDTTGFCMATDSIFIASVPIPLTINANTTFACPGDSVFAAATSQIPGNYTWFGGDLAMPVNDSSLAIVVATSQTYYIQFTSAVCDTVLDSISILVTSNPSISVNAFPDPACAGVNTNMVAIGPGHGAYIWSGGSLTTPFQGDTLPVTINSNQTYTLDWFGPNCLANTNFTLNVVNINLNITSQNPLCALPNGSITVNATGGTPPLIYLFEQGGTILQNGNMNSLNNIPSGTYDITVLDTSSGCSRQTQVVLVDEGFPIIDNIIFTNTPIICCDDVTDVILEVSGGSGDYNFSWAHDVNLQDSIAPNLQSGQQYTVQVIDPQCPAIPVDSTITVPGPAACINIVIDTMPDFCSQSIGNITLHITGGVAPYDITWGNGTKDTILSGLTAGNYNYIITDDLGCTIVDNAVITNRSGPMLDSVKITCLGFGFGDIEVFYSGKDPLQYSWSHDNINRPWDTGLVAGTFFVQVIDSAGCASQVDTIIIPPASSALLDLGPDTLIVRGQSVTVDASTSSSTWIDFDWFTNETFVPLGLSAFVTPDSTTDVYLMLTDIEGCSSFDTITIFVDQNEVIVSLPTLFTPNADNVNDTYGIVLGADKINNIEFQVFDRWGDNVYSTRDPYFNWNGVNKDGNVLPPAVYVYLLEYETFSQPGVRLKQFGDITLIR
ncbi:MAG: T9SS type B sorting domain-containing protein [Bacteroidia bacterium]|nr:T9SS type B sorting domain-containing protein [Bacteroidia bacterium]